VLVAVFYINMSQGRRNHPATCRIWSNSLTKQI
jgi:hypothetical protein